MTELRAHPEALLAEVDWLRRLTRQLVRDSHAAEDLVQDTVMAALSARRPQRAKTRTWLEGIARKLAALRFRSDSRRRRRERGAAQPEREPSAAQVCADFALHGSVVQAVMALDESTRVAVVMRFWEDLPPREIARRLDVPVETVRTRIKRGLARLRARLDAEHGDRRAWALPLLALGPPAKLAPVASSILGVGAALMSAKVMVSAAAAVLGVLGLAFAFEVGPFGAVSSEAAPGEPTAPAILASGEAKESAPAAVAGSARATSAPPERTAAAAPAAIAGRVVDPSGAGIADVAVCLARPEFFEVDPKVAPTWYEDPQLLRNELYDLMLKLTWDAARRARSDVFGSLHDRFVKEHCTRSDGQGAFRFAELPDGPMLVCAWHPDHGLRVEVFDRSEPAEIVMGDWPRVTGRVTTEAGSPIAAAVVRVSANGRGMPVLAAETDRDGRFRTLPVPPGKYHVDFDHDLYVGVTVPLVELSEDREVDVSLPARPEFSVTLEDGERQPWTAARLRDLGWDTERLRFYLSGRGGHQSRSELQLTDSEESLEFDGDLGKVEGRPEHMSYLHFLSVWHGGERIAEAPLPAEPTERLRIDFARPAAELILPVTVVCGARVHGTPEVEVRLFEASGLLMTLTDALAAVRGAAGTHALALPARLRGHTCYLSVRCEGFAEYVAPVAVPERGQPLPHEAVLQAADITLRGRVVDASGRAVRGATVALATAAGTCLRSVDSSTHSDGEGAFEFENLSRRDVRLFVQHDDWAVDSFVVQTDAAAPLVLRLFAGSKRKVQLDPHGVQLRVLDAQGAPLFDDRFVKGSARFGYAVLVLPEKARSIEAYRPTAHEPCAGAVIPPSGAIQMKPR